MICRYMSQPERLKMWASAGNALPDGMRLGWNCDVPYCGDFEHMELAENKNARHNDWKSIRGGVRQLEDGQFIEVPMSRVRGKVPLLMANLHVGMRFHLAFRTSLDGSCLRIYRTGDWMDQEASDVFRASLPVLRYANAINAWLRPTPIWLGQFRMTQQDEAFLKLRRKPTCDEKGCVFPANGNSKCHRHAHFFEFKWSMEWRALDKRDVYGTEDNPQPLLSRIFASEVAAPIVRDKFMHKGECNKGWKLSEDWWNENVRKYEAELEAQRAIRPPAKAWANVIREPKIQYSPESSATANKQHTGAFVLWKGFGKKKIRKKQRMRPQGWHGNHPEQKPRERFTRETLDEIPQWAPSAYREEPEADESLGDYPEYTSLLDSTEELVTGE